MWPGVVKKVYGRGETWPGGRTERIQIGWEKREKNSR